MFILVATTTAITISLVVVVVVVVQVESPYQTNQFRFVELVHLFLRHTVLGAQLAVAAAQGEHGHRVVVAVFGGHAVEFVLVEVPDQRFAVVIVLHRG